jgi:hypothetical protein
MAAMYFAAASAPENGRLRDRVSLQLSQLVDLHGESGMTAALARLMLWFE